MHGKFLQLLKPGPADTCFLPAFSMMVGLSCGHGSILCKSEDWEGGVYTSLLCDYLHTSQT